MQESDRLRVGIVGCGYQGNVLARAIRLVDTMVVTACADIIPERAEQLAASCGRASAHVSAEDLLANSAVDLVMVATPHDVLAPIALLAIQAGKHILVEKPCGMNAREVLEIQESAAGAGVSCLAGYSFRYTPAWYKVHELLAQGVIGEIQAMRGFIGVGPINEGWKSTLESGGGPLMYVGSHLVDQALWYLQDDPVEVYASIKYRADTGADEISAMQIQFSGGATAQLICSQNAGGFTSSLDIYGRGGSISMVPCGYLDYEIKVTSSVAEQFREPVVLREPIDGDVRDVKHSRQLKEFAAAIRGHKTPFVTAGAAHKVMEVIDAVLTSSCNQAPVDLIWGIPA